MSRGVGLWDRHGEIRTLTGSHADITDQKNREEELKQLHADMEAFTYITSHDMRSPLVNLKGFSHELTLAIGDLNALLEPQKKKLGAATWARIDAILHHDVQEALGFIGNAVDRMDTLTTAILDLSRIGKYVYRDDYRICVASSTNAWVRRATRSATRASKSRSASFPFWSPTRSLWNRCSAI